MKTLLIQPPQWIPTNPYSSVPLLNGQLVNAGFETDSIDLNQAFYLRIFNSEYLAFVYSNLISIANHPDEIINKTSNDKIERDMLQERKKIIIEYFQKHKKHALYAIKYITDAKKIINSDKFYDINLYYKAHRIFEYALELVSAYYAPAHLTMSNFYNPLLKSNYKDIKYQLDDKNKNPYIDFYQEFFNDFVDKYNLIILSITSKTQILPSLTFLKMLRSHSKAHVSIGGNLINRIYKNFLKYPEVFDMFFDSISYQEGENSIIQLAQAIKGKCKLDEVPGIVYRNSDLQIKINPKEDIKTFNSIANSIMNKSILNNYFSPENIYLIQASKGCYWGKCSFCDMSYGKSYILKDVKKLIQEIEFIQNTYNISKFWFIDECLTPHYYEELADEILKRKIKIDYYVIARLEKEFTQSLCNKLYKSGLKVIMWGFECASDRVFKLMNKGINPENRLKVLENSSKAGIWNHVFLIFGFPSETSTESDQTINFMNEHKDIIDSYHSHLFSLQRFSHIYKTSKEYEITQIIEDEEFEECYKKEYNIKANYQNEVELKLKIKNLNDLFWKDRKNMGFCYLLNTDFLLYISKYGRNKLKKINLLVQNKLSAKYDTFCQTP